MEWNDIWSNRDHDQYVLRQLPAFVEPYFAKSTWMVFCRVKLFGAKPDVRAKEMVFSRNAVIVSKCVFPIDYGKSQSGDLGLSGSRITKQETSHLFTILHGNTHILCRAIMKREIERNHRSLRGNLGMRFDRRKAILGSSALTLGLGTAAIASNTIPEDAKEKSKPGPGANVGPREAEFSRDYEPPAFKPSWKAPQLNRTLVQDFVIFAHSDLKMVEKLLEREPKLINSAMDWGNGDFETALGGASHMGRKEIVRFLLSKGARIDIFCAAMMGMLEVVQAMLTLEPKLIDVPGPHGFNLHFHAQVGQKDAVPALEYLQSVKELKLRPVPFLNKKNENK